MPPARPIAWIARSILMTLGALVLPGVFAESPRFVSRHFGKEQGLPGNSVRSVLQTKEGYLWCATDGGVARFDGLRFTTFNRANSPELPSDDCRALAETPDGTLWIGTAKGLAHLAQGILRSPRWVVSPSEQALPPQQSPDANPIEDLAVSADGALWVVSGKHAYRRTLDATRRYPLVRHNPGGPDVPQFHGFRSIVPLPDGSTWAVTEWGPGLRPAEGKAFEVGYATNVNALGHLGYHLTADPQGTLWALIGDEANVRALLTRWNGKRWEPVDDRPVINHSRRLFVVADHAGDLWLPDQPHRLVRFRSGVRTPVPLPEAVADDYPTCLAEDRDGDLWVGTENRGLVHLRHNRVTTLGIAEGLPDPDVRTLLESRDGSVWIGTDGGLARFQNGSVGAVDLGPFWTRPAIRALLQDREGGLWIGGRQGLGRLDASGFRPSVLPGEGFHSKIRSLAEDREGRIWIASAGGVYRMRDLRIEEHVPLAELGVRDLTGLLVDRRGRVWLGTQGGGLVVFGGETRRSYGVAEGLPGDEVTALHEDPEGHLWTATTSGIAVWSDERWHPITPRHGLPSVAFNQILADEQDGLWLGMETGLHRLSRQDALAVATQEATSLAGVTYGLEDGLPALETHGVVSHPAGCRTRDGRIWIPTVQGVAIVDPKSLPDPSTPPIPLLQELRANGRLIYHDAPAPAEPTDRVLDASATNTPWSLPAEDARYVEFRWSAPTFCSASEVRFAYRLEGIDEDWIEAGTRRQAFYANLGPGTYRLHLKARNPYGKNGALVTPLAFRLTPPFYREPAWIAATTIVTLGLLVSGIRWREAQRRRIRDLEAEARLLRERERLAHDLHDGMGAHLTHIALLADWEAETGSHAPDSRWRQLSRASRDAIQSLKDILWSAHPQNDTLASLIGRIESHAAQTLEAAGIRCRLVVPARVADLPLPSPIRTGIYLAVKEVLHNAVRHSGAREVTLQVALPDSSLVLSIRDDGRGFDPTALDDARSHPTSDRRLGLPSLRERLAALGGRFELDSKPGHGTEVRLTIPLHRLTPPRPTLPP